MSEINTIRKKLSNIVSRVNSKLLPFIPEVILPAIHISASLAEDSSLPIGISKFGGFPDIENYSWPHTDDQPMIFLGQINLKDLHKHDEDNILPPLGLLSFFLSDQAVNGCMDDPSNWAVYYEADLTNLRRRDPPPGASNLPIVPAQKMSFTDTFHPFGVAFQSISDGERYVDLQATVSEDWWEKNVENSFLSLPPPFILGTSLVGGQQFVNSEMPNETPILTIGGLDGLANFPFLVGNSILAFSYIIKKDDLSNKNFNNVRLSYDIT